MPNATASKVSANGRGARAEATAEPYPLPALFNALQAMKNGDFSVRMNSADAGLEGKIADVFNEIVAANQRWPTQLEPRRPGRSAARARPGSASSSVSPAAPGARWNPRSTR